MSRAALKFYKASCHQTCMMCVVHTPLHGCAGQGTATRSWPPPLHSFRGSRKSNSGSQDSLANIFTWGASFPAPFSFLKFLFIIILSCSTIWFQFPLPKSSPLPLIYPPSISPLWGNKHSIICYRKTRHKQNQGWTRQPGKRKRVP